MLKDICLEIKDIYLEIAVTEETPSEQPIMDSQTEGEEVTNPSDLSEEENVQDIQDTPQYIDLDGEQLTLEQIREFKQGYLRQSDYTKKTQILAQERERLKEAVELYEYLQSNPEIAQRLVEEDTGVKNIAPTQENQMLKDLSYKIATIELEAQLDKLKAKDPDLDEIELLTIANQRGVNLDDAYNIYRGLNFDKILERKLKEQSANLTKQIQQNGNVTKTLISGADKVNKNANYGLSDAQLNMAKKLGMTPEEYAKWM